MSGTDHEREKYRVITKTLLERVDGGRLFITVDGAEPYYRGDTRWYKANMPGEWNVIQLLLDRSALEVGDTADAKMILGVGWVVPITRPEPDDDAEPQDFVEDHAAAKEFMH